MGRVQFQSHLSIAQNHEMQTYRAPELMEMLLDLGLALTSPENP